MLKAGAVDSSVRMEADTGLSGLFVELVLFVVLLVESMLFAVDLTKADCDKFF